MKTSALFRWAGLLALTVPAVSALLLAGAGTASATTRAVCPHGCPYTELAAALAASFDGDTITLSSGTYAGGMTVAHSVRLVGAGATSTVIRGGGPVLTIGTYGARVEPTVSISGVTITGGVTRSGPESKPFVGEEGVFAAGGGVEIPPNADFSGGAVVTIKNSVITGNRVAPTHALPFGPPCPNDEPCPFAAAVGGGIDSWGTLTLISSTVSNNLVGTASGLSTVASDAEGGGIRNYLADLTIIDSVISGNQATASAPNGRFADSGAIFVSGGALTMRSSSVTGNRATLDAALPDSVDMLAISGGIHLGGGAAASIRDSSVSHNTVTMSNTEGSTDAFSAAIHADVDESGAPIPFELRNDVISHNKVVSLALGSSGNAAGDSAAGEMAGTVMSTRISGNSITVRSAAGDASAFGGAGLFSGSMTDSVVSGNTIRATSPNGSVSVAGAGLHAGDFGITLRGTSVTRNTADGRGRTGSVRGGGIFDVTVPDGPPGGPLALVNTAVTGNVISGSPGVTLHGGGIFVRHPVTSTHSLIVGNSPDQCDGC